MDRLRKRRDFLAAAKAGRAGGAAFMMQARDRGDGAPARVGFTVTKKIGNAVVRNRVRRRLRAAAGHAMPNAARAGHDYVIVAREGALSAPFDSLLREIERSLRRLDTPRPEPRGPGGPSQSRAGRRAAAPNVKPTPADGGPPA